MPTKIVFENQRFAVGEVYCTKLAFEAYGKELEFAVVDLAHHVTADHSKGEAPDEKSRYASQCELKTGIRILIVTWPNGGGTRIMDSREWSEFSTRDPEQQQPNSLESWQGGWLDWNDYAGLRAGKTDSPCWVKHITKYGMHIWVQTD